MSLKQEILEDIAVSQNMLIIQDIDGVCIPLVKDPLKRVIRKDYVLSASRLNDEFAVLTCGEHEGPRGVNRIIETTLKSAFLARKEGLYLPGLAACAIEYQDNFGNISYPGVSKEEIEFLCKVPLYMEELLIEELLKTMPLLNKDIVMRESKSAICDTRFSPNINLNRLFNVIEDNIEKKRELQSILHKVMNKIITYSSEQGLKDSFYLHISPNLGSKNDKELLKFATEDDIGTTDIQLILNGALKEAGLLVLLNKYILKKTGKAPFGNEFNVKLAPKTQEGLIKMCKKNIALEEMPRIIGVGDTVTSHKDKKTGEWLRGGSDRGFLTLIQELGCLYDKNNILILVDSSYGEVYRPRTKGISLEGISDNEDKLKFNLIMNNGTNEYIEWFKKLSLKRRNK